MVRRIIYTGEKPDIPSMEYIHWKDSPFDELLKSVGSVDMLIIDQAYLRNDCIDALNKRIITHDTQRKVRIIKILNINTIPERFGAGYIHRNGNGIIITECPTEKETLERLDLFNRIGVYIIRLAKYKERVESANELAKSLDMLNVKFIDGVDADTIEMKPMIKGHMDRFIVTYPGDPNNQYIYSKSKFDEGKMHVTNGMKKTEMGCALAHIRTYREYLNDMDTSTALIFEEDTMVKNNDINTLHRILFYYPHETLGYVNFSECVDWFPLDLDSTINGMYFRAQRKMFNRTCAYAVTRDCVNSLFKYIQLHGNVYMLAYTSDDILCRLCMEMFVTPGAPYYRPFTLRDMKSTIE